MRNYNKIMLGFALVLIFSLNIFAQQTESVSFTIRTTTPGGSFSPKNIGAIWVEDSSGNFIKTLQIWADKKNSIFIHVEFYFWWK
ncbi:MAG: hypothetical protein H6613_08585 [Ignavibacteriales bacterium]|nr:hypothetical protein [Ignavibacteriales bacterium]